MPEKLKCLSLRQPWAEEIMLGNKTIEYRTKSVKFRGKIYIYASLGRNSAEDEAVHAEDVGYDLEDLPRGVVVGTVEIVDCVDNGSEFEWQLANPVRLAKPLPPKERPQPVWFHPFGKPAK